MKIWFFKDNLNSYQIEPEPNDKSLFVEKEIENLSFLKDKQLIKYNDDYIFVKRCDKDERDYIWNGNDWEIDLQKFKNLKREELKAIREEKIHSNIEVHGEIFQVRAGDMEHFDDAERAVTRNVKKPTDIRYWILADNSIKPFTYEQIRQVLDAKALRKEQVFIKFGELSMKLEKAQSIEEIEAIVWEE